MIFGWLCRLLSYNVKSDLNGEVGSMWKEALVLNYFEILSDISLGGLRKITKQHDIWYVGLDSNSKQSHNIIP